MQTAMTLSLLALLAVAVHGDADPTFGDDEADIEDESLTSNQLRKLHEKFDSDTNGRVSLDEVIKFAEDMTKAVAKRDVTAVLAEMDTNKDGKLSMQEHMNDLHNQLDSTDELEMQELEKRKALETAKFNAADDDNDGYLNLDELAALFYPEVHEGVLDVTVKETMRIKDTNKDGVLTPLEFWEADQGEDQEELGISKEEEADFAKLDKNGDGVLSSEELRMWESGSFHTREAMRTLFEVADVNSDMHITASELVDAREHIAVSDAQYHLIEWAEHHEL